MGMEEVTGEGSIPGDFSTVTDLHTGACLEDGAPEDRAQGHEPTGGGGGEKGGRKVDLLDLASPANLI